MDSTRYVVVLDVNVYLEVAELLGEPFEWANFDAAAARTVSEPVPCRHDGRVDSLRVIAMCTSGRFAGEDTVEVWTSAHIDRLVRSKAHHPTIPTEAGSDRRGLGWSAEASQALVDDLVAGLTERSNGGTIGHQNVPDGDPPLDHEDGMVYGACRELASDDLVCTVLCVTRDGGFLKAYRGGRLPAHTRVLSPPQMVALMREARHRLSIRRLPRPPVSGSVD